MFFKKGFPKIFTKFTEKYLCYSLLLILLKTFRPTGLQLYWRETPALAFQNQPFINHLQNRCSWIIHKIHRKTPFLESLFSIKFRSRHSQMLFKIIANFTGKHLCCRLHHRLFPVKFVLQNIFSGCFWKFHVSSLQHYLKKDSSKDVFLWILQNI